MNVVLYADNTFPLQLSQLATHLNTICKTVKFSCGEGLFRIRDGAVRSPDTYKKLDKQLLKEVEKYDLALLATSVPYENNFFWQSYGDTVILSFFGWNQLTDLPMSNGLAYFAASLINDQIGVGETHNDNIGCINDFWWDKRGVDIGMRAAFVCSTCAEKARHLPAKSLEVWNDVNALLSEISNASRVHKDLMSLTPRTVYEGKTFDVFMCHNAADKPQVGIS